MPNTKWKGILEGQGVLLTFLRVPFYFTHACPFLSLQFCSLISGSPRCGTIAPALPSSWWAQSWIFVMTKTPLRSWRRRSFLLLHILRVLPWPRKLVCALQATLKKERQKIRASSQPFEASLEVYLKNRGHGTKSTSGDLGGRCASWGNINNSSLCLLPPSRRHPQYTHKYALAQSAPLLLCYFYLGQYFPVKAAAAVWAEAFRK